MRSGAIATFAALLGVVLALAGATAWFGVGGMTGPGDFRGIAVIGAAVLLVYSYGMLVHRAVLAVAPGR